MFLTKAIWKLCLSIFLFNLASESNTQKCKKYTCGDLAGGLCLLENNSTSPNTIIGKSCTGEDQFCPAYKLENEGKAYCQSLVKSDVKQYPGGPCAADSDCVFSKCSSNSTCLGVSDGEKCNTQNCLFNRACYALSANATKTCNKLKSKGDACVEDYECPFSFGCFQGFCKSYYSLFDDADISSSTRNNFYSFCKSGFDLNGFCTTLLNLDENGKTSDNFVKCSVSNECKYVFGNGTVVTKTDVCDKCGKSKDGFVYCPVYGGLLYSRYVDFINKTLSDPYYSSNCNTIERKGVCNFYKKNANLYKNLIETISTYQVRKQFSQEFANADDCIVQIYNQNFNPKIDNPIDPVPVEERRCPVFQCDSSDKSKEKTCAISTLDIFSKRLNISLYTKSCSWDKEICDFSKNYNTTVDTYSRCLEKPKVRIGKQYPGEPCNEDSDCYAAEKTELIGICGNKTKLCLGKERGETCGSTEQCVKGLYCQKGDLKSTCEYQLGKDKNCTNSFDCANYLACVNSTCKDAFYSLNVGDVITADYDASVNPLLYCKTRINIKSPSDGKLRCATFNHSDAKNSTESDLVRCNYDQMCNYTMSDLLNYQTFQYQCDCGYNSNGQGYCRRGNDASKVFFSFYFFIPSFFDDK